MIKGILGGLLSGGVVSAAILGAVSLMSAPPAPRSVATAQEEPLPPTAPASDALPGMPGEDDMAPTAEDAAPEANPAVPVAGQEPAPATASADAAQDTVPEAAVISPPAGSGFDKPAEDAPVAAPAPDSGVVPAPPPTATGPDVAEPVPPAGAADTAPMPSPTPGVASLADAPDAEAAPAAPAGMDQPASMETVPVPAAPDSTSETAPVAPAEPPAASSVPPESTQPAMPANTQPAPADDAQPDAALLDEPEVGPLPDESTPGEAGDGAGGMGTPPAGAKRVLPPVLKLTDKPAPEAAAPSDQPPAISFEAPAGPQGVTQPPKPGFARTVPGVRMNRLPTIGTKPEPANGDGSVAPPDEAPTAPDVSAAPGQPETRMHRNAAFFENPEKLPVLAVIVIDIGEMRGGVDLAQVLDLPMPVTVAINPQRKDTLEAAARCRARGFEVAMLADALPQSGTAEDIEVAYQAISAGMPEAVAVMTSPENSLLSRRPVAQQMVAILKDEGLGLVSYARGLNPARELARGQGLAQVEVNRVVDEPRGDVATVLRALENEAFAAQQKGGGVVVVRSYPDSIAALTQFMAKSEAPKSGAEVKVGPVTAVLK